MYTLCLCVFDTHAEIETIEWREKEQSSALYSLSHSAPANGNSFRFNNIKSYALWHHLTIRIYI